MGLPPPESASLRFPGRLPRPPQARKPGRGWPEISLAGLGTPRDEEEGGVRMPSIPPWWPPKASPLHAFPSPSTRRLSQTKPEALAAVSPQSLPAQARTQSSLCPDPLNSSWAPVPWSACCSNYDLDYELYREDVPYRVYEYHRIPPLIKRVPVKIRRTHVGMGVKRSFSPHKVPRNSQLPPGQIKLQTKELHSIRGELSQIKAQVDHLLESLEHMDQQREQRPGTENSEENRGPGSKGSSSRTTEPQQEPGGQRAHPEAHSSEDSTDPEEAVKNHASDQEGG
ncbi:hypothetical protein HPG69_000101, partial [Diceros bicornis minor]